MRGLPPPICDDSKKLIALLLAAAIQTATPAAPLHAVYTVDTNKLGQVVRVRSANASGDANFNRITRSNALQTFIRRANGTAVSGVYKLTYDYSPKTKMVHRDVQLVRAGGVDPNAPGAVTVQLRQGQKEDAAQAQQVQRASQDAAKNMPDFDQIVK